MAYEAMVKCPPNTAPWVYEAEQEERVNQADWAKLLGEALLRLTPKQERVVRLRFVDDQSLVEIADQLGVTRERIRQIEGKALRNLGRSLRRLVHHKRPAQAQGAEPHSDPYAHKKQMRELIAHFRELKRERERELERQQQADAWAEEWRRNDARRQWTPMPVVRPWWMPLAEPKSDERLNSENGDRVVYVLKHCYASMPQGRIQFMAGERWRMGKEHAEALERLGFVMVLRS